MIEIAIAAIKACEPENPDVERPVEEELEAENAETEKEEEI